MFICSIYPSDVMIILAIYKRSKQEPPPPFLKCHQKNFTCSGQPQNKTSRD